ncbi:haloacid dehalogenase-like hydrolase [Sphingomonas sp. NSE70-1]|uniref:Haloacid dehalogenase-like hydrolase n=1 Tax=Sphingomonas caseinilyticus TaxID=2908205 RepID=A0ABT0RRR5_9SPHN|nr:haloacid dehalogenase-like hydrolase [Sphingomonas caseinilyticus]MCL6697365.1 haloacid dehalogenase-like hydrolase [Sphingomonas caseinilyticus]
MSDSASRLVIFDVCDTLYDANTTIGFIRYYQSRHASGALAKALSRWLDRGSPFFYAGAAAHHLLGWDVARQRIIAALDGEPRSRLTDAAFQYVRDILPASANQPIHDRLKAHQEAGDRVILMSSSIDLVVSQIAAVLDTEYRASVLEFDDDLCTGRLAADLTGRKADQLRGLAGPGIETWVYTDNRSDKNLVASVGRATIVLPRGRRQDRWAGDNCEYISL